jgi:hypothetical protein
VIAQAQPERSYPDLVPLKVREVIKLLEKNGWRLMRTKGDHRIFSDGEGRPPLYRVEPATMSAPAPTAPF